MLDKNKHMKTQDGIKDGCANNFVINVLQLKEKNVYFTSNEVVFVLFVFELPVDAKI